MNIEANPGKPEEERDIQLGFEPEHPSLLLVDILLFTAIIKACFETADKKIKKAAIEKILSSEDWFEHFRDKKTGRRVLSETELIEHKHELITATLLAKMDYDVVFAPKAMFARSEKKFDVFLMRAGIILKADLKSISSKNPDTIANRIKGGSEQASRVVIDITSDVEKNALVNGLRSGVERNKLIKEILLLYKSRFYRLPKDLILSKKIYNIL
ncbi:MAG: hypothetical protein JWQ09_3292 [Segetibacter sp.]|nr:hypothetical protein [Segetibacter sp.]